MQLPEEDRYSYDRDYIMNRIAVLFGGRIAEEVFMNQMTTGAGDDFKKATEMARRMVTEWGMSDALGPMVYGENEGEVFLGRSVTTHKNVSETTMQKVDAEIRRIIDQQYGLSRRLIEENRDKVETMAKALLEWETLDSDQIADIMEGRSPRPPRPDRARRRSRRRAAPHGTGRRTLGRTGYLISSIQRTGRADCPAVCLPTMRELACGRFRLPLSRPLVMGIVNVTPDSFSDGGRFASVEAAVRAGTAADRRGRGHRRHRRRVDAAGGCPGAGSRRNWSGCCRCSKRSRTARFRSRSTPTNRRSWRAALAAGASMVNDVKALREPGALEVLGARMPRCASCTCRATPQTMQDRSRTTRTWLARSATFLRERVVACEAAGIDRARIVIDPGFGFGKTKAHNIDAAAASRAAHRPRAAGAGRPVAQVGPRNDHRQETSAERVHSSVAARAGCRLPGRGDRERARRGGDPGCPGGLRGDRIQIMTRKYFGTDGVRGRVGEEPDHARVRDAPGLRRR